MLDTLKVFVSSKSNWIGSWMKNPSRIVQYKDTIQSFLLWRSLGCKFLKVGVSKVFTHLFFLWFTPLILAIAGNSARLGWYLIWSPWLFLLFALRFWGGLIFCLGLPLFVCLFICFFFWACCRNGIWNVLITLCWLHQRGWNLPGLRCYPVWQVHTK